MNAPVWMVYVLVSNDDERTYVGITIDVERRLAEHNGERPRGARSTRPGRPWRVGTKYGPYDCRADALRAEHRVKRLRGPARLSWVE